jgi:hypothetical protein
MNIASIAVLEDGRARQHLNGVEDMAPLLLRR